MPRPRNKAPRKVFQETKLLVFQFKQLFLKVISQMSSPKTTSQVKKILLKDNTITSLRQALKSNDQFRQRLIEIDKAGYFVFYLFRTRMAYRNLARSLKFLNRMINGIYHPDKISPGFWTQKSLMIKDSPKVLPSESSIELQPLPTQFLKQRKQLQQPYYFSSLNNDGQPYQNSNPQSMHSFEDKPEFFVSDHQYHNALDFKLNESQKQKEENIVYGENRMKQENLFLKSSNTRIYSQRI